ncbi:MAG: DtxR family transcriptional regulator [Syntrophobacteraceae bacterium CG2_30_61_12]|nr:MAG: DtxR family transcriptional regulator [Syntrophobacteraceae bacterium CG2_30_61_12]PIU31036.1 MAG: metal-dependent transcriptional regulator [Syntrophobacteraceae bacterium CG07_land_8_20_14_0_80_61_8]
MKAETAESLSASLEDYLEVIYHLEKTHQVARAKDIAERMRVQRASVTGALKTLAGRGLINYSPYKFVTMTEQGERVAREIIRRHETLKEFFIIALQLDPERAEANACRIEHAIGKAAIERLVQLLDFIKNCPRAGPDWLQAFADFCRSDAREPNCRACLRACLKKLGPEPTD